MSERIESRTERRRRREQRRAGILGLAILGSSIAATVALLLVGQGGAHGAAAHHGTPLAAHVAAATAGDR